MHSFRALCAGLVILASIRPAAALGPENIFLLVNKNVAASREVAVHYCDKRGVSREQIITLDLPAVEDISREDYNRRLVGPLRAALREHATRAKVLVSVYGMPLRVGPVVLNETEKAAVAILRTQIDREEDGQAKKKLQERLGQLSDGDSTAAVDSELMLLWWESYDLRRFQVNLLHFQAPPELRKERPPLLMVSRLDGPSPAIARRLVDLAVAAEEKGLTGKVYVDARGIGYSKSRDAGHGYGGYDESLREMARQLQHEAKMPVTLDDKPELFPPGSCPDCALYCGWYSLANYVDCCRFVPGAVAYHIASSEAVSLRDPNTKQWCKSLLERGVAATVGPVAEPYTVGFPKPAEFFGYLLTGRHPLVECYALTTPLTSWRMILIGDPLYNPYAKTPRLKPEQVRPSPLGSRLLIQQRP